MNHYSLEKTQQKAAKIAGFMFLAIIIIAIFSEFYLLSGVFIEGDIAVTANNIMANANLYRIAVASELISFTGHVVLAIALYIVFKPINHNLAQLALFWRLIETAVFVVALLNRIDVLHILDGADYLSVFDTNQLHALATLSLGAYNTGYTAGVVFFCLGSTIFSYLFFKSNYIPKTLAAFGIFASLLCLVGALPNLVLPDDSAISFPYGIPIFLFEVILGFWLILKGINLSKPHNSAPVSTQALSK